MAQINVALARQEANGQVNEDGRNEGVRRAEPIEEYEKGLRDAWRWACAIGSLHACSRFLAFCNLSCATAVLLGAFVPYLVPIDFKLVVLLVLLEGVRLSSASFFARLLTRALAYLSQDPKKINHGQDEHYPRAQYARIGSQLLQIIFISPGLIMSTRVFDSHLRDYNSIDKVRNVQKSLRIFYGSVMVNSLVALLNVALSATAHFSLRRKFPTEQSILRYFDKVLENATRFGVVQADDFDFFRFAYTMLGGEFRRNVQPKAVAKNHKKLIKYMYAHRLGLDSLQIYLDAEDTFVRLAAVNMVGFWAERTWGVGVAQQRLRLPEGLLMKLADKVETGQVGWAAANSFGALAASTPQWAGIVAGTCTSSKLHVPNRLANLVDDSSSRSLSLVRSLVGFYEQLCKEKKEAPMPFESADTDLVPKLKKLAREARVHRLRVQAAYLLRLMNKECDCMVILGILPTSDDYWFQSEVSMLQLLRKVHNKEPFEFLDPHRPVIQEDHHDISPPPWALATVTVPPTFESYLFT